MIIVEIVSFFQMKLQKFFQRIILMLFSLMMLGQPPYSLFQSDILMLMVES